MGNEKRPQRVFIQKIMFSIVARFPRFARWFGTRASLRTGWFAVWICLSPTLRAEGPDDRFIEVYNLIQTADQSPNKRAARGMYEQAQEKLRAMQRDYPIWNERVINYRLRYTADKLGGLANLAADMAPAVTATNAIPASVARDGEVITQFNELTQQIRLLQTDKQLLEAKLREALSAQPAPVDPREFQAAIERIATLQQTNKVLLKNLQLQQAERANLVDKLVVEEAQSALAEANQQLATQRQNAEKLDRERVLAAAELKRLQDETIKPLRFENSILKQQMTGAKSDTEKGRQTADLTAKLARLELGLEELKHQNETLSRDKVGLEKQLDDYRARSAEEGIVKVAQLESQLAVAKADSARQTARVEDITARLAQEKQVRSEVQAENQNLSQRVADLTTSSAADVRMMQKLQDTLAAEKAERTQAEAELKTAEQKLFALQTMAQSATVPANVAAIPSTTDTVAETAARDAQRKSLEIEVQKLRDAVKSSDQRETELTSALSQEKSLRQRLEREKGELETRLAVAKVEIAANRVEKSRIEVPVATTVGMGSSRTPAELESRVRLLEKEREELRVKLVRLTQYAPTALASARMNRAVSPRDRASEFLLQRQAMAFPSALSAPVPTTTVFIPTK